MFFPSSHRVFIEVCKECIGPAKEEALNEQINDVDCSVDENDHVFTINDSVVGSENPDDAAETESSVLEYKCSLLQKCLDILDMESEESAISEDFMFRVMFRLRYKETIVLTQKLLYGYSKYALVEMLTCRVEYHTKMIEARERSTSSVAGNLADLAHKGISSGESLMSAPVSQTSKKKMKRKAGQAKRKTDLGPPSSEMEGYQGRKNGRKNRSPRRGCTRCARRFSIMECRCGNPSGTEEFSDWAYQEIINGLQKREVESLTSAELTNILVLAMTEDICEHEAGDGQCKSSTKSGDDSKECSERGHLKLDNNIVQAVAPTDVHDVCPITKGLSDSSVPNDKRPNYGDEEKRIFDMLIERYGRHMEHNRLDYYSGGRPLSSSAAAC